MSVLKTQKEEEVETKTKGGSFVLKTGNQHLKIGELQACLGFNCSHSKHVQS